MHIHSSIRTSFGLRQLPPPPTVRVQLTHRELDALIRALDRDAIDAQNDGRLEEADKLATRIAGLRDVSR